MIVVFLECVTNTCSVGERSSEMSGLLGDFGALWYGSEVPECKEKML